MKSLSAVSCLCKQSSTTPLNAPRSTSFIMSFFVKSKKHLLKRCRANLLNSKKNYKFKTSYPSTISMLFFSQNALAGMVSFPVVTIMHLFAFSETIVPSRSRTTSTGTFVFGQNLLHWAIRFSPSFQPWTSTPQSHLPFQTLTFVRHFNLSLPATQYSKSLQSIFCNSAKPLFLRIRWRSQSRESRNSSPQKRRVQRMKRVNQSMLSMIFLTS